MRLVLLVLAAACGVAGVAVVNWPDVSVEDALAGLLFAAALFFAGMALDSDSGRRTAARLDRIEQKLDRLSRPRPWRDGW